MIIRGFSSNTTYDCSRCHAKCCATEYELPLIGSELPNLIQEFPEYNFLFHSSPEGDKLLRGDACSFLNSFGHCLIHNNSLKPFSCRLYPLILWKFTQEDILVWINPCRGHGFSWFSSKPSIITDTLLQELILESNAYYNEYWGEMIDLNNPFLDINSERVLVQNDYIQRIPHNRLLDNIIKKSQFHPYSAILDSLQPSTLDNRDYTKIFLIINSVLHWLVWSPVNLVLTSSNSDVILSIAALWLIENTISKLDLKQYLFEDPNYLQQLGSYFATSLQPSFWTSLRKQTNNKDLQSFARQTHLILTGKLPQQQLNQYLKK